MKHRGISNGAFLCVLGKQIFHPQFFLLHEMFLEFNLTLLLVAEGVVVAFHF
jgi:hypothetical protein